jgi:hypothetical protein
MHRDTDRVRQKHRRGEREGDADRVLVGHVAARRAVVDHPLFELPAVVLDHLVRQVQVVIDQDRRQVNVIVLAVGRRDVERRVERQHPPGRDDRRADERQHRQHRVKLPARRLRAQRRERLGGAGARRRRVETRMDDVPGRLQHPEW